MTKIFFLLEMCVILLILFTEIMKHVDNSLKRFSLIQITYKNKSCVFGLQLNIDTEFNKDVQDRTQKQNTRFININAEKIKFIFAQVI